MLLFLDLASSSLEYRIFFLFIYNLRKLFFFNILKLNCILELNCFKKPNKFLKELFCHFMQFCSLTKKKGILESSKCFLIIDIFTARSFPYFSFHHKMLMKTF